MKKGVSTYRALMAGVAITFACTVSNQAAQAPNQAAPAPNQPAKPRARAAAEKTTPAGSVRIGVRDQDGASLSDVRIHISGPATDELVTGGAGTAVASNLKDGVYRIRCEREGFITLEREFAVRGSAYSQVDVVLNAAPPPPPKPAPAPPPPPAPAPAAGGPPVTMSIVDYLDHNLIGREPLKESVLACNHSETVRLLQMREGIANHVHDRGDEIIYVVAGEGAVRIGAETTPLRAGSLVVVTNGNAHGFERRGKNPLIVVSTLVGTACDAVTSTRE